MDVKDKDQELMNRISTTAQNILRANDDFNGQKVIQIHTWYNRMYQPQLTYICLVDWSILINWTNPFPVLGVSDVRFHFYSISNRYSC